MSESARKEYDNTLERMFRENMATHPPEFQQIAEFKGDQCGAEDGGFTCTLKEGHTCDHVAHGSLGYIHHRWARTEQH